jgi:hypothetical protein
MDRYNLEFMVLILTIRILVLFIEPLNPYWVSGFVDGEGSFMVSIQRDISYKHKERVKLNFSITQHTNNILLLYLLEFHFLCGGVHKGGRDGMSRYQTGSLSDINNIIIPFFDAYPLQGIKAMDYADFRKVAQMMASGFHRTSEG